jgi:hypothetical protein
MSKSVDDKTAKKAENLINSVLEPEIKRFIEEANVTLKKYKVHLGAEIKWFIDKLEEKETE